LCDPGPALFLQPPKPARVDLLAETTRLINKVRPLVAHEGWLVVINNALFLSGADFMAELNQLCQSPYLAFETTIPVPPDVTGYPETITHSRPQTRTLQSPHQNRHPESHP
jgi:23S rRNA (cytosine1962-C5)-methyltransferase